MAGCEDFEKEFASFLDDGICSFTIPSKDVREYCRGKVKFSTRQKATLLFNNNFVLFETAILLYKELIRASADEKDEFTKKQLEQQLDYQLALKKKFFEPEPEERYCYAYRIKAEEWNRDVLGYFSTFEKAKLAALKTIKDYFDEPVRFSITKFYIDSEKHIFFNFNEEGEATDGNSVYFPGLDDFMCGDNRFEDEYVRVPYPFRRGDFIKSTGDDEIGIFAIHKDEKEYLEHQEWLESKLKEKHFRIDVTDMSTRAEYFDADGRSFYHDHPFITTTEYAVLTAQTPHKEILEAASKLMKGEGSIEFLQYLLDEMK